MSGREALAPETDHLAPHRASLAAGAVVALSLFAGTAEAATEPEVKAMNPLTERSGDMVLTSTNAEAIRRQALAFLEAHGEIPQSPEASSGPPPESPPDIHEEIQAGLETVRRDEAHLVETKPLIDIFIKQRMYFSDLIAQVMKKPNAESQAEVRDAHQGIADYATGINQWLHQAEKVRGRCQKIMGQYALLVSYLQSQGRETTEVQAAADAHEQAFGRFIAFYKPLLAQIIQSMTDVPTPDMVNRGVRQNLQADFHQRLEDVHARAEVHALRPIKLPKNQSALHAMRELPRPIEGDHSVPPLAAHNIELPNRTKQQSSLLQVHF